MCVCVCVCVCVCTDIARHTLSVRLLVDVVGCTCDTKPAFATLWRKGIFSFRGWLSVHRFKVCVRVWVCIFVCTIELYLNNN